MNKNFSNEKELMWFCKQYQRVFIYGAGFVGKLFLNRCRFIGNAFDMEIETEGFLVSERKDDIVRVDGLPLIELREYLHETSSNASGTLIVVAVKEENQSDIISILKQNGIDAYVSLTNICINDMLVHQNNDISAIENRINELEQSFIRMIPKPAINISHHLTDACNLNCKGCWHFSPLAKCSRESFRDPAEFEKDVARIAEVMEGEVTLFSLFGGEPLMHPQAYLFPYIIKKYLPDTYVEFLTNGVLIPKQDEKFWKSCLDNDVTIEWTQYPIKDEINKEIESVLKRSGVKYRHFEGDDMKCLSHDFIDVQAKGKSGQMGRNDARYQWLHCFRAGECIQLKNHRLYPCSTAANAHILRDYFQLNMRISPLDGIDIYSAKSKEEITSFLAKPIPFCRYCNVEKMVHGIKWSASEKKLEEWT